MFTVRVDLTDKEETLINRYAQAQGKTVEELFKTALFEKIAGEEMREEYDFSRMNGRKNPYAEKLK